MKLGRILRIGAAIAILISGIVHLDLYFNQDYRFASPDVNFGRSILLNAIASGIIATALVARKDWFVKLAGILFAAVTIVIFAYTHSEHTFLGYSHGGPVFEPSPQAQIALVAQIAAIVLLALSFIPAVAPEEDEPIGLPVVGGAFAVCAVVLIGLTLKWKPDDAKTVTTAPTTSEAPTTTAAASTATTVAGAPTTTPAPGATTTTVAGGASTTPATGGAAPAGDQAVAIANFAFAPADLTVAAGTTVTWTNMDSAAHTVVASDKSFTSDNLDQGATFQFKFDKAGTYAYICGIHNYMKGTITVTG